MSEKTNEAKPRRILTQGKKLVLFKPKGRGRRNVHLMVEKPAFTMGFHRFTGQPGPTCKENFGLVYEVTTIPGSKKQITCKKCLALVNQIKT